MNNLLYKDWFKINKDENSAISFWSARITVLTLSVCLVWVLFFTGTVQKAMAQSAEVVWDEPVNLSRSGGTTNPQMVIDSSGKIHVIWEDRFEGYFYSFHNVDEWSSPVKVDLPFEAADPQLIGAQDGVIHAFWIDEDDRLQHSYVAAEMFDDEEAWEVPDTVGVAAVNFAAILDENNNLHVAYVRPLQTTSSPAGIYYKNSLDGGTTWSSAENLYSSSYLRGVTSESSHISISSATSLTETNIFVSWDNRSRRQVFVAKSDDGGESWTEPREIDRPGAEFGASRPFNIQVSAQSENVLLIWQNGIPAMSCSQYYVWSNDGGETWSERLPMPSPLSGCPQGNSLLTISQTITLLLTTEQWQGYLQAWDGLTWSDSQGQPLISTFEDPDIFESIILQCLQADYHPIYDRLFVVGCDEAGGGDIWVSSRLIGDVDHWYPPPPVWSVPEVVASSEGSISSLTMAASDEKVHLMWIEKAAGSGETNPFAEFYYSRLDENNWTRPAAVLGMPGANPGAPSLAVDAAGRLLAVWGDRNNGNLYFQWANASQANSPASWTAAQELPSPASAAWSPHILATPDGVIYVTYAVPLNEERGVYLTRSSDRGETWSQPVRIFDAGSAGWDMVDNPHLAIDDEGLLHAVFMRHTLPGGRGPLGLYYARSSQEDGAWSGAELVVEKPVLWSRILSAGDRGLHRAWLEVDAGRRQINHQYSLDGGISWSRPEVISNYAIVGGLPELAIDPANQLHLLQVSQDIYGDLFIYHWQWEGVFWYARDNFAIEDNGNILLTGINSVITNAGKITTVYSSNHVEGNSPIPVNSIVSTSRSIEIPDTPLQPIAAPQAKSISTPEPTQVPLPTLTPTIDVAGLEDYDMLPITSEPVNSSLLGVLIGGSLATVLVGLAFVVGVRKVKGKR